MATVATSTEDTPLLEERDQLHQSIKKFKSLFLDQDAEDVEMRQGEGDTFTIGITNAVVWSRMSFADKVREQTPRPPIYIGEGEIDDFDEIYLPCIRNIGSDEKESRMFPWCQIVHIPAEDY